MADFNVDLIKEEKIGADFLKAFALCFSIHLLINSHKLQIIVSHQ